MFLLGTKLDFEADKFASSFTFKNPNQTAACGCGESVSITPATERLFHAWAYAVERAWSSPAYRGQSVDGDAIFGDRGLQAPSRSVKVTVLMPSAAAAAGVLGAIVDEDAFFRAPALELQHFLEGLRVRLRQPELIGHIGGVRVLQHAVIRPDVVGVGGVGVGEDDDAVALRERQHKRLHAGLFAEMAAPEVEEMRIALREATSATSRACSASTPRRPVVILIADERCAIEGPRRCGVGATGGEPVKKQIHCRGGPGRRRDRK